MIKNIGKLKQWTGEKFGSAKTTLQTEDFQRLEIETERKRIGFEKLHAAAVLMQMQLSKKKISPEDNKSKKLPNDILGVCFTSYGNEFTDDAPVAGALINFGQAQSKISCYQEDYAESMRLDYLEKLDEGLQLFKEYASLRKKLESRRLDYDAKIGRLQKSKKEKPELEQELQASKLKYEDSEYDVIQKMVALQEFEDEHYDTLNHFLDIQLDYFQKSLQTLQEVKSTMTTNTNTTTNTRHNHQRLAALSRTSSTNSTSLPPSAAATEEPLARVISRKASTDNNLSPPVRRAMGSRSASFSDHEQQPSVRPTPPSLPRRQSQSTTTQRKAVYDFGGDNSDELSFEVGDIITVIEEVDEGWWLGESQDGRRGIFPVNYTELMHGAGPPMPARPTIVSTTIQEEPVEMARVESPFGDSKVSSYSSRPTNARTLSASPMSSPIPRTNSHSNTNTTTTTKRAPPPPPVSRTPPVMASRSQTTSRTAPSTPQYVATKNDYFDHCVECGCDDFSANIFKKGHCNNCFHKH